TAALAAERAEWEQRYDVLRVRLQTLYDDAERDTVLMRAMNGGETEISVMDIVRAYQPNSMNIFGKLGVYGNKVVEFLTDEPREANTEGGIFPAIFGTVVMVLLMSV